MKKQDSNGKSFKIALISAGVIFAGIIIVGIIMSLNSKKPYTTVNKEELAEVLQEDERFLLVVSRTWCKYCNEFKAGALNDYKGDLPIYVIEIDEEFFNAENPRINNGRKYEDFAWFQTYLIENGLEEYVIEMASTEYQQRNNSNGVLSPTTLLVENKVMIDYQIGALSTQELNALINDNK